MTLFINGESETNVYFIRTNGIMACMSDLVNPKNAHETVLADSHWCRETQGPFCRTPNHLC